jgi:hypothetical protein
MPANSELESLDFRAMGLNVLSARMKVMEYEEKSPSRAFFVECALIVLQHSQRQGTGQAMSLPAATSWLTAQAA